MHIVYSGVVFIGDNSIAFILYSPPTSASAAEPIIALIIFART